MRGEFAFYWCRSEKNQEFEHVNIPWFPRTRSYQNTTLSGNETLLYLRISFSLITKIYFWEHIVVLRSPIAWQGACLYWNDRGGTAHVTQWSGLLTTSKGIWWSQVFQGLLLGKQIRGLVFKCAGRLLFWSISWKFLLCTQKAWVDSIWFRQPEWDV